MNIILLHLFNFIFKDYKLFLFDKIYIKYIIKYYKL